MKAVLVLIFIIFSFPSALFSRNTTKAQEKEQIATLVIEPVNVYGKGFNKRRYWRLVQSVKRVYPLAKVAQQKLRAMEKTLDSLDKRGDQRRHVREVYKQIRAEYTPIMLKMTQTDGRVLIRLIDRETDYTAYEVVDEFKGSIVATFWQGIGRLFGQNLKAEYGTTKEDQIIEQIIKHYEAGML